MIMTKMLNRELKLQNQVILFVPLLIIIKIVSLHLISERYIEKNSLYDNTVNKIK